MNDDPDSNQDPNIIGSLDQVNLLSDAFPGQILNGALSGVTLGVQE
jgi:hypothetical protein